MAEKDTKTFTFKFVGDSTSAIRSAKEFQATVDSIAGKTSLLSKEARKQQEAEIELRKQQNLLLELTAARTEKYRDTILKLEAAVVAGGVSQEQAYNRANVAAKGLETQLAKIKILGSSLKANNLSEYTQQLEKAAQALAKLTKPPQLPPAPPSAPEFFGPPRPPRPGNGYDFSSGTSPYRQRGVDYSVPGTSGLSVNTVTKQQEAAFKEQIRLREQAAASEKAIIAQRIQYQQSVREAEFTSYKSHLTRQLQESQRFVQAETAAQIHGIKGIEAVRIQSAERQRKLIEERDRKLGYVSGAVAGGSLSQSGGSAQAAKILSEHNKAILENNKALLEQEKAFAKAEAGGKLFYHSVRNIIAAYATFVSLKNTIGALGKTVLDVGIELDSTKASLLSTSGSMSRVDSILVALDAEAQRTGISIGTLRENFRNLSASMSLAGESTETTYKVFTNLNTVSTALHLTSEKTQGVFLAIAQIFNKSKVQSEELVKQLGNLLPGAFAAFATATGRSTQQLSSDMKKGLVYAHDTIEDFTTFMANRFAKAFELSADNVNANIGRMNTSFTHLSETIYEQTNGAINSFVKTLTNLVDGVTAVIAGTSKYQTTIEQIGITLTALTAGGIVSWLGKTAAGVATTSAATSLWHNRNLILSEGLVGLTTRAGGLSKVFASLQSFAVGNFFSLMAAGLVLISSEFGKSRKEAEGLNEYLNKMAEARKILADNSKLPDMSKEQRIDFKVSNDSGVKTATERLLAAKEALVNFSVPLGMEGLPEAKRRLAEVQALYERAHDNLVQESKRARTEIAAIEDNAAIESTEKEKVLAEKVKAIHEDLDNSLQGRVNKRFREYKASIQKEIDDLEAIIARGEPKQIRDTKGNVIEEKARKPEEVAAAERARDMLAGVWKDSAAMYEQIKEQESNNVIKIEDKLASKEIELTKKVYAEKERASKNYYDKLLLQLDKEKALLDLQQNDSKKALGSTAAYQAELSLIERRKNAQIAAIEAQIHWNSLQQESVNSTAAQVEGYKGMAEGAKALIPLINQLETGFIKNQRDKIRAVSPTGALGQQQVQPSTLASHGIDVPADILALERKGKSTGRLPGGKYKALSQIFSGQELERLRSYAESIQSTLVEVQGEILDADYKFFKGNAKLTVAAYNAGRGGAQKAKLPPETQRYLENANLASGEAAVPRSTNLAVVENLQAANDEGAKQIEIQKVLQQAELERAQLTQDVILSQREQGDEILQQIISQKEYSGELVEAAKLQNALDFSEKKLLLSKADVTGEQKEINEQLLKGIAYQEKQNILLAAQEEASQRQAARMAELNLTFAKINQQQTLGNTTDFESLFDRGLAAKAKLPAATKDIEAQIAMTQADATLSPAQKNQQVADLQQQLIDLQNTAEGVSTFFKTNLTDALASSFMAYTDGSKTAIEATKAFGMAVVQMIAEIILKKAALIVINQALLAIEIALKMVGGGMGFAAGGEVASAAGSGASTGFSNISAGFSSAGQAALSGSYASGGNIVPFNKTSMVRGTGTETSDDILATVPLGSFILNAKAARMVKLSNNEMFIDPDQVKKIGVGKLNRINDLGKYSEGGYIDNVVPMSRSIGELSGNSSHSVTNQISVTVNHTGKEKPEELGQKVGVEIMKKIAKQESQSAIAIYDKTKRYSGNRSI